MLMKKTSMFKTVSDTLCQAANNPTGTAELSDNSKTSLPSVTERTSTLRRQGVHQLLHPMSRELQSTQLSSLRRSRADLPQSRLHPRWRRQRRRSQLRTRHRCPRAQTRLHLSTANQTRRLLRPSQQTPSQLMPRLETQRPTRNQQVLSVLRQLQAAQSRLRARRLELCLALPPLSSAMF